tara:strand:+ start:132 stop:305 length:174 start_codon:yes stop_codon:yes gene_type:complete
MKLSIQVKSVYGRELVYPFCKQSQLLAQLLNVKTFSEFHIGKLKALHYEFETVTNTI